MLGGSLCSVVGLGIKRVYYWFSNWPNYQANSLFCLVVWCSLGPRGTCFVCVLLLVSHWPRVWLLRHDILAYLDTPRRALEATLNVSHFSPPFPLIFPFQPGFGDQHHCIGASEPWHYVCMWLYPRREMGSNEYSPPYFFSPIISIPLPLGHRCYLSFTSSPPPRHLLLLPHLPHLLPLVPLLLSPLLSRFFFPMRYASSSRFFLFVGMCVIVCM